MIFKFVSILFLKKRTGPTQGIFFFLFFAKSIKAHVLLFGTRE